MILSETKIVKILNIYDIPQYVAPYLMQCNMEYSIQFLVFLVLAKFKPSDEMDGKKLNFSNIIMDNIVNNASQMVNSDRRSINFGTGNNKYVLSLPSDIKINDNQTKDIDKTIFQAVYKIMFDQEISQIKYDVIYTLLAPIMLMLNIKLKEEVLRYSNENILQYSIGHIVKYYIKKMNIPFQLKGPLENFFHAALLSYKEPDIINDDNVFLHTNSYVVHFRKIDGFLIEVDYEYFPKLLHLYEPLIIYIEDDNYQKFMKAFLLLFSKFWDKKEKPSNIMAYGTENILKELKTKKGLV